MTALTVSELQALVERVFAPQSNERRIALLCDLPDETVVDRPAWKERREMALQWRDRLRETERFEAVDLFVYPNVTANNADLPDAMQRWNAETIATEALFERYPIVIALTELSASAPLKINAPKFKFRAASMPGFSQAMLPALRLDFDDVQRRCDEVRRRLDDSQAAVLSWRALGREGEFWIDLRHRTAVASGGVLRTPGIAGNLPSGETFIVPYEGELADDPSRTEGRLPLEIDGEVMFLEVQENRVVRVEGEGPATMRQRQAFEQEPAFANVAELGLGLLGDYGVRAVGETLLDEKLGVHVAFGRSNHFPGGTVGPQQFSSPDCVSHIDYIYVHECQPQVDIVELRLRDDRGDDATLMLNGRWTI